MCYADKAVVSLLSDTTQPDLTSVITSPFIADLCIKAEIAVVSIAPWLTNCSCEAEAVPVRRSVLDLTNPVSVQVTGTDTTQGGVTTATSASTNAQQSHVGQDSVGTEHAQVTTHLDGTPGGITKSHVGLTNVQAVALTTVAREAASTNVFRVHTSEECKLERDVQIVLTSLTTNAQSRWQQTC